jgi:hypothetical protein
LAQRQITPDYYSRLFYQTALNANSWVIVNTRHPPDSVEDPIIPFHLFPPLLHQRRTGEIPVAIHLNARDYKHLINEMWGQLWWNKKTGRFTEIVDGRIKAGRIVFVHDGQMVTYGDLCANDLWQDPSTN